MNEREEHREKFEKLLREAVMDGRLIEASLGPWRQRWAADPKGAEAALAGLAPGLAPDERSGERADPDEAVAQLFGRSDGGSAN